MGASSTPCLIARSPQETVSSRLRIRDNLGPRELHHLHLWLISDLQGSWEWSWLRSEGWQCALKETLPRNNRCCLNRFQMGQALLSNSLCVFSLWSSRFTQKGRTQSHTTRQVHKWGSSSCCPHPEAGFNHRATPWGAGRPYHGTSEHPKNNSLPPFFFPAFQFCFLVTSITQKAWFLNA